ASILLPLYLSNPPASRKLLAQGSLSIEVGWGQRLAGTRSPCLSASSSGEEPCLIRWSCLVRISSRRRTRSPRAPSAKGHARFAEWRSVSTLRGSGQAITAYFTARGGPAKLYEGTKMY